MKAIIVPPQSTPFLDVQEKLTGFEWLTAFVNKLVFNRIWYLFFSRLAKSIGPTITEGTLDPNTMPTGLGVQDAGWLFYSTDYFHWYRWSGTAWGFMDGGSEYIVRGTPTGSLWAPCDGGTYLFSQDDGSLISKASEDLTAQAVTGEPLFLAAGAATGARTLAASPTWDSTNHKTGVESATHTHSVTVADGGNVTVQSGAGTTFKAGLAQTVASGNESAQHTHNLTNADAVLNPPSVANGGLAFHKVNLYFMRR